MRDFHLARDFVRSRRRAYLDTAEGFCAEVSLEVWDDPTISHDALLWAIHDSIIRTQKMALKLAIEGDA